MKPFPPLNYRIWVTANNYTWFPIRIRYMSDTVVVYTNVRKGTSGVDIPRSRSFNDVFCDWKITLDGTENEVYE
ncbi:hypothetical protein Lw1_gp029 [Escherichia phage Lw1]|uniref:Uncharacterized protein n=2 Tax=Pseudotevenvirus TaxID=2842979 RepID=D9IC88_BPRB1|nr:hypothetical protein RB16p027 [Escherichia phage RB16]YP_008060553.1 hypothetical protein Lw1_gp029 [Escherichia phage Lw1]ADJ55331.1 hypothetical protein RB16p027 [Escherichia phage RB16]AGJ71438.1 hypothetical protein Lw1_gp029 [Escherichia phage Lw1]